MLADLGADVVKVEAPGGDGTRRYGVQVNGIGPFFSQQNCGKRSVSVDLSTHGGRELCLSLADVADVVVENFRPGVMDRLGLGWEVLRERNPRLVYAAISGYGREGERAQRRALANVVHAEAGLLERQARRDGRTPVPIKWSAADTYSSLELLAGVLAALLDRATTGHGQRVEVSMIDSMLSVDDFAAFDLWPFGDEFEAQPDPILVPASDGWMMISANPVLVPEPFFELMHRTDLLADPRFVTRQARQANREALIDEIAAWSRELPADALDHLCDSVGMAAGVCRTTRDAISIRRDTAIVEVSDRGEGVVPLISSPQQFSHAESGIHGVVAYLGEHNEEVLREWLGRSDAAELRTAGVLHSGPRPD
jgi:crotonobetainyl-CoA:carnitine CoA-transferase CaiB-like acyl-CoA transferase